ncbi:fungal-specific transcription factor domain-containing protein [Geopyxis carbonaria]|nr:fungal-specific transcription factor domain-containing protein [Geopyxis carbonaria]
MVETSLSPTSVGPEHARNGNGCNGGVELLKNMGDKIGDMELFVNEMMRRRDALGGVRSVRKRKIGISGTEQSPSPSPSPSTPQSLRGRLLLQRSFSSSGSETSSGEYSSDISSPSESGFSHDANSSPIISKVQRNGKVLNIWPRGIPQLPIKVLDDMSIPLSGWNPTTMTLPPPRPPDLEDPRNRDLMRLYIEHASKVLSDTSPTYIDLFRKYIPAMAQKSPALLGSVLAFTALHEGLRRKNWALTSIDAREHYDKALRAHYISCQESLDNDALLATVILLSHFEIWNGENVKMGVHMLGGRSIIVARGKSAHVTPIGRALYTTFKRMDIVTSWITGNPTFLTHDWWTADPFTRIPILSDSPALLVADAALAKLCVICAKLTYLKAWATRRRRDVFVQKGAQPIISPVELEKRIASRVSTLEDDLRTWYAELPEWFDALPDSPATGEDGNEEDINTTTIEDITPRRYQHRCIALVHGWAIGVAVQLFRIRNPNAPVVTPKIGSLCHALLRIFAFVPSSSDGSLIAPLFAVGMELRQICHQEWLSATLKDRLDETSFHGIDFLRNGLRFAWLKFSGISSGRFNRIKEGAASKIDGVSENLWAAEGMLGTFEKLSLYDSPDIVPGSRKNFQGDVALTTLDHSHIPLEVALANTNDSDRHHTPKRVRSRSPEVIVIDDSD